MFLYLNLKLIFILLLFWANQTIADIYKHVDTNGKIFYTDEPKEGADYKLIIDTKPRIFYNDIYQKFPQKQTKFVEILNKYSSEYELQKNELQKSILRDKRKDHISKELNGRFIKSWVGIIESLTTNSNGDALLTIGLTPYIFLHTRFISSFDRPVSTIIKKNSQLYNVLLNCEKGRIIKFSGEFLPSTKDYIDESSITEEGSIKKPEFIFKFGTIELID